MGINRSPGQVIGYYRSQKLGIEFSEEKGNSPLAYEIIPRESSFDKVKHCLTQIFKP